MPPQDVTQEIELPLTIFVTLPSFSIANYVFRYRPNARHYIVSVSVFHLHPQRRRSVSKGRKERMQAHGSTLLYQYHFLVLRFMPSLKNHPAML